MAEDIKRFTENGKACLKDAPEQCNETLRQHTIPDRQGSKIGETPLQQECLQVQLRGKLVDQHARSYHRSDVMTVVPQSCVRKHTSEPTFRGATISRPQICQQQKWKDTKVVKRLSERSYVLDVDGETVRRNLQYFRPISEDFQSDKQNASTSEDQYGSMNREDTKASLRVLTLHVSGTSECDVTETEQEHGLLRDGNVVVLGGRFCALDRRPMQHTKADLARREL
ncbi:hypothetical protein LSAT2_003381 [Lamellibrachia satsuma]|nr:hypothetical protein LSAT2_003381 [Lamellibrachia satsuma]